MYREEVKEMVQLLKSIYRVVEYSYDDDKNKHKDEFESHIFFDDGCRGGSITPFAIQLVSLVPQIFHVKLEGVDKQQTPYGYRLCWMIDGHFLFVVHLKDNEKVRKKARWSRVMYMKYIIEHRAKDPYMNGDQKRQFNIDSTFVLATDADVDFTAESAIALLDMLVRDNRVGAVCAHTQGHGPIYWYQVFDYVVAHWLIKPAEHILGSVLCCPGCFSMFRCSALRDCLKTYSTEVESASKFLMKDMGEDRWLCTLLTEKGWRLEYCALSDNHTFCPNTFDEFYKQRRRWIPSIIANLWELVSNAKKMVKHNNSMNWLFTIYEAILVFVTIISPSTVIVIVSFGLNTAFGFSIAASVIVLSIISMAYGLVCIYGAQQTQLDLARMLTWVSAVGSSQSLGEITLYVCLLTSIILITAALHMYDSAKLLYVLSDIHPWTTFRLPYSHDIFICQS